MFNLPNIVWGGRKRSDDMRASTPEGGRQRSVVDPKTPAAEGGRQRSAVDSKTSALEEVSVNEEDKKKFSSYHFCDLGPDPARHGVDLMFDGEVAIPFTVSWRQLMWQVAIDGVVYSDCMLFIQHMLMIYYQLSDAPAVVSFGSLKNQLLLTKLKADKVITVVYLYHKKYCGTFESHGSAGQWLIYNRQSKQYLGLDSTGVESGDLTKWYRLMVAGLRDVFPASKLIDDISYWRMQDFRVVNKKGQLQTEYVSKMLSNVLLE